MANATRNDLRNVAIVAHVDHGKTTLVDAMLRRPTRSARTRTWKSARWTRTTSSARRASRSSPRTRRSRYKGVHATDGPVTINVIDTPGHADFGGEVERGLSMVDGVVLLVDASEGPLPQTRFVLRKALEAKLPVILLVNKTDRPDARIAEVEEESHDLLLGLASDLVDDVPDLDVDALLDVPVVYASGRPAAHPAPVPTNGTLPDNDDLEPLFEAILEHVPAPSLRRRGAAAGVGHEPRLSAVPRPPRAAARLQRHAEEGPDGRLGAPRRHHSATRASPSC